MHTLVAIQHLICGNSYSGSIVPSPPTSLSRFTQRNLLGPSKILNKLDFIHYIAIFVSTLNRLDRVKLQVYWISHTS